MTVTEALSIAVGVRGEMYEHELVWLGNAAAAMPADSTWVELGVFYGRSFTMTGLCLPPTCRLIGVDIFKMSIAESAVRQRRFLADRGIRADILVADAAQAVVYAPDVVNVVFIDADHDYAAVRQQIVAWLPRVARGGLLCGHDYGKPDHPGVQKAVQELLPDAKQGPGSIWYYRIP